MPKCVSKRLKSGFQAVFAFSPNAMGFGGFARKRVPSAFSSSRFEGRHIILNFGLPAPHAQHARGFAQVKEFQ